MNILKSTLLLNQFSNTGSSTTLNNRKAEEVKVKMSNQIHPSNLIQKQEGQQIKQRNVGHRSLLLNSDIQIRANKLENADPDCNDHNTVLSDSIYTGGRCSSIGQESDEIKQNVPKLFRHFILIMHRLLLFIVRIQQILGLLTKTIQYIDLHDLQVINSISIFYVDFVKWTIAEAQQSFRNNNELKVLALTWNLHGKKGPTNLEELLFLNKSFHHIYIISTQQCERSILSSVFFSSKKSWENKMKAALGDDYYLVKSKTLTAMHMALFSHNSLQNYIKDVEAIAIKAGLNNTAGNKGGIAISLRIGCTDLLFINSHFASGQHSVAQRRKHYLRIERQLKIATAKNYYGKNQFLTDYFNAVIWMGDLNYRIQLDRDLITDLMKQNQYTALKVKDQLFIQKYKQNAFVGYNQLPIEEFAPTYKFLVKSRSHYNKKRVPGWTDRILTKYNGIPLFEQVSYDSNNLFLVSDHRPVFGQFRICFEAYDQSIKYENNNTPGSKACQIF